MRALAMIMEKPGVSARKEPQRAAVCDLSHVLVSESLLDRMRRTSLLIAIVRMDGLIGGIGVQDVLSMRTRLSRLAALLTALIFAVPTLGPTLAEAQAGVTDAANLYPGRYAAVCTPAPIFGCVCATDSLGEALMFTELDSTADHHLKEVADSEHLQLISWLRRTCASLTQPATAR